MNMQRHDGQGLIEVVAGMGVCMLAAAGIVQAGVVFADSIATTNAASRAGSAVIIGSDPREAALGALPSRLRDDVVVKRSGDVVRVTTSSSLPITGGRNLTHVASANVGGAA